MHIKLFGVALLVIAVFLVIPPVVSGAVLTSAGVVIFLVLATLGLIGVIV